MTSPEKMRDGLSPVEAATEHLSSISKGAHKMDHKVITEHSNRPARSRWAGAHSAAIPVIEQLKRDGQDITRALRLLGHTTTCWPLHVANRVRLIAKLDADGSAGGRDLVAPAARDRRKDLRGTPEVISRLPIFTARGFSGRLWRIGNHWKGCNHALSAARNCYGRPQLDRDFGRVGRSGKWTGHFQGRRPIECSHTSSRAMWRRLSPRPRRPVPPQLTTVTDIT